MSSPIPAAMIALRDLAPGDTEAVSRIYSGASLTFTRGPGRPMSLAEASDYALDAIAQAQVMPRVQWWFGIAAVDDLVGVIGIRRRDDIADGLGTIGYLLRDDTWGRGYGTAAVRQAVTYAFTATELVRLSARYHPENPASGCVLAKAGFRRAPDPRGGAGRGASSST